MNLVRLKKCGVNILLSFCMVFTSFSTCHGVKAEVVDGPKDAGYTDSSTEGTLTITYDDTVDNGTDKGWNMQTLVPGSDFLKYYDSRTDSK